MTPRRWPLAALLLQSCAVFLSVTTELLPTGLLPSMSRDLGVSAAQLGLLVTGYAAMVALFAAPMAALTARIGRRPLLSAALASYAVSSVVLVFAHGYPLALAARLIGGLTHGLFWAILGGYTASLVPPERLGRAVTITSAGGTAAVLIGVPAGTALGVAAGWRVAFSCLAGIALLLAALSIRLLPDVPGSASRQRMPLREVMRLPGFRPIAVTTAVSMLGAYSFITYVAPYLQYSGLSEDRISLVLLGSGLIGLLMLGITGAIVDRWLRTSLIAGGVSLIVVMVLLAVSAGSPIAASIAASLVAIPMGLLPIAYQTIILRVAPEHADQASGMNASAFNIGIAGGALFGGIIADNVGVPMIPVVGGVLATLGLVAFVLPGRRPLAVPAPATSD